MWIAPNVGTTIKLCGSTWIAPKVGTTVKLCGSMWIAPDVGTTVKLCGSMWIDPINRNHRQAVWQRVSSPEGTIV